MIIITLENKNDVILHTAGKYCADDIVIKNNAKDEELEARIAELEAEIAEANAIIDQLNGEEV